MKKLLFVAICCILSSCQDYSFNYSFIHTVTKTFNGKTEIKQNVEKSDISSVKQATDHAKKMSFTKVVNDTLISSVCVPYVDFK